MQYKLNKATLPTTRLIDLYLRNEECRAACSHCRNYGRQWSCPPFAVDPLAQLSRFSLATILAVEIPVAPGTPSDRAIDVMAPAHPILVEAAMELERQTGGRASCTVGECRLCTEPCARQNGMPCRHPNRMRPSPEAIGFDLVTLLHDLFHIDLQWGADGFLPSRLYLIGAVFHNQ
ncbi:MAG: DUF2284 domain-containing protein [Lepagella sp.]